MKTGVQEHKHLHFHKDLSGHRPVLMVEATKFEARCLWQHWHGKVDSWSEHPKTDLPRSKIIGTYFGRPVKVEIKWVRINGRLVGFYHPASERVDYAMLNGWIDSEFKVQHIDPFVFTERLRDLRNGAKLNG